MKHSYIKKVFINLKKLKEEGIYFSGTKEEGEYKEWWENGRLFIHRFYKNSKLNGENKKWHESGKLRYHELYKDGEVVKDYLKESELI